MRFLINNNNKYHMCLIIHKPKNKRIPTRILEKAKIVNPHGFGITYLDDGKTLRSLSYKSVNKLVDTDRPIVCHFQLYCRTYQLIQCTPHSPLMTDTFFIQMVQFKDMVQMKFQMLHTLQATFCQELRKKDWLPFLELTDTRFALIDIANGRVKRVGKWFEQGGVFYSKEQLFRVRYAKRCNEKHRVAVYGTLKRGYGNHRLLADSRVHWQSQDRRCLSFARKWVTYLYDKVGVGERVRLEVTDVDDETLDSLDSLEGHPTFYERRKIWVSMDDWSKSECWVYFINQELPRALQGKQMCSNGAEFPKKQCLVRINFSRLIKTNK